MQICISKPWNYDENNGQHESMIKKDFNHRINTEKNIKQSQIINDVCKSNIIKKKINAYDKQLTVTVRASQYAFR